MNDITEIVREASADRGWRGLDVDKVFSRPELSDDALTATEWCARKFSPTFPGWQLYRRVVAGSPLFDDELDAWVVGGARLLARARTLKGRCYIEKRGPWIDQAARDALTTVIHVGVVEWGILVPTARARAAQQGVDPKTWVKVYRPLVACLLIGLDTYTAELHYQYRQVKIHAPENGSSISREAANFARVLDWQSGNRLMPHSTDSDGLHPPLMPDVLK